MLVHGTGIPGSNPNRYRYQRTGSDPPVPVRFRKRSIFDFCRENFDFPFFEKAHENHLTKQSV